MEHGRNWCKRTFSALRQYWSCHATTVLNSVDTNRVRSIWLLLLPLLYTFIKRQQQLQKKPGWLTDWDEKGIPCTCNTFQALLPYYRYSYTSERSDDVFAYIHIVRICKVRIKYIQMILNTFLKTILKGLNLNLGHRLIVYKVFIFSDFFLIFENTAQNCWVVFHSSQCKSIWFFLIDNFKWPIKNEKKSKKSQKKTTLNFQRYDRKCV